MIKLITVYILLPFILLPVNALEIEAPKVPESGELLMPDEYASFGDAILKMIRAGAEQLYSDLVEVKSLCIALLSIALLIALVKNWCICSESVVEFTGVIAAAVSMLSCSSSLIRLATDTIQELCDYGKLLLPVMTTAMAAQGGVTASAALYAGTAAFDAMLSGVISSIMIPGVYVYLSLSAGCCATGELFLKNCKDMIKSFISWFLKILLTVYTTYMSITGVISGTTDAAALKATKVTISTAVPVVGGILSDASEAVLVSAALLRNTVGIYGTLAIVAVFLRPFMKIGVHYLLLKVTGFLCGAFDSGKVYLLIDSFATVMGLLLAMTGSVCLMLLISTVCFMREVG